MYESFGVNIGEAMAVGAFPVIHDFPGADRLWPSECLFAAVEEAVELIRLSRPSLYRDWVAEHYSLERQEAAVLLLLDRVVMEVAANSIHAVGKDAELAVRAAGCTAVEAEQTRGDVEALAHCDPATQLVAWRGVRFRVIHHTAVADALASFQSDFEVGTLEFFDAVLPFCDRMIDIGAYAGLMSLYAANRVANVLAFEASPTNFSLLEQDIAANDGLRERVRLYRFGLGNRDEMLPLYAKGVWDSGSSIFRTVERGALVNGVPEAMVQLRDANTVLRETGVTGHTLLKIDVEGAEYLVVPAIAALLAEVKPFLHLSFHPFNLVAGADEYVNTLTRIRCAMEIGEALAPYRFMYCRAQGQWVRIESGDRMIFLREYLLRHKVVPRVGSPQYGFIDAIGFTDVKLSALDEPKPTTPPAPG
jgi:FkbM family methyltransferase